MRSITGLLAVLALLAYAAPAAASDEFTPVTVAPVAETATAVLGTDGRYHVVYELALDNTKLAPATLDAVEVRTGRGRVIDRFEGADLLQRLRFPLPAPADDLVIEPFAQRDLYIDLAFRRRSAIPRTIVHTLSVRAAADPGATEPTPMRYLAGRLRVGVREPARLGPPLAGPGWVVTNGCCDSRITHRGSLQGVNGGVFNAQRFAIDWIRIDAGGRFLDGDPADPRSYHAYGARVLAVADARVVSTLSNLPDQVPGRLPDPGSFTTLESVDGNQVVLDLGDGRYVNYAHLQRGSVRVRTGQRVRRGQVIGLLGNSGNTSAPHLHLHVMDGPSPLGADGLPFVFDRFALTGRVSREEYEAAPGIEGVFPRDAAPCPRQRRDQFPLDLDIVRFP